MIDKKAITADERLRQEFNQWAEQGRGEEIRPPHARSWDSIVPANAPSRRWVLRESEPSRSGDCSIDDSRRNNSRGR